MKKIFTLGVLLVLCQGQQWVAAQDINVLDSFMRATDSFMHDISANAKDIKIKRRKSSHRYVVICKVDGVVYRIQRKTRYRQGMKFERVRITRVLSTATIVKELEFFMVDGEYTYVQRFTYSKYPSWEKLGVETATADIYVRKHFKSGKIGLRFWAFRRK